MRKAVQKQLLTFISTWWGMAICVLGIFLITNSLLSITQTITASLSSSPSSSCSSAGFTDNLMERSYQSRLCLPAVDVVYTWVNGSDERLIKELEYWKSQLINETSANVTVTVDLPSGNTTNITIPDTHSVNRFRDNEELRYSLRSLWRFAPWIRHVWIVTNGQIPHWINLDHPRLTMIQHSDIFGNLSHLPTFSSPSIESHLHEIPGLADKFIYFNDDVMLGNTIWPDDFYTHANGHKVFLSWNVPNCAPGCPDTWIHDNYCDSACNNEACQWDGGDCANTTDAGRFNTWDGARSHSTAAKYCTAGCPNNWVGDKVCDRPCKNAACAFDGGDCGLDILVDNHVYDLQLQQDITEYSIPFEINSFYINLTNVFYDEMTEATHDSPHAIRSAIITQHLRILTVIFFDERDIQINDEEAGNTVNDKPAEAEAQSDDGRKSADETNAAAAAAATAPAARVRDARRVEFIIGGSNFGSRVNMTFYVTRPRTGNRTASRPPEPAPVDDNFNDPPLVPAGVGAYQRPAVVGGNNRRLLSVGYFQDFLHRTWPFNTVMQQHNVADTEKSPSNGDATPFPFTTSDQHSARLRHLSSYGRSWSDMNEVDVLGVPRYATSNTSVKLQAEWSYDDYVLAEQITVAKKKELWWAYRSIERERVLKALYERMERDEAAGEPSKPIWPWELGVMDVELWAEVWSWIDHIRDANDKENNENQINNANDNTITENVDAIVNDQNHIILSANTSTTTTITTSSISLSHSRSASNLSLLRPPRRRLLDTFGDSLRFANQIFSTTYGRETRKAPAHMPHFIDKNIMYELHAKWPQVFNETSAHKFRHGHDMQFSFSYYYYVINEPKPFNLSQLWIDQLDFNGDGQMDLKEAAHLAMIIAGKRVQQEEVDELYELLVNVSRNYSQDLGHSDSIHHHYPITQHTLEQTPDLLAAMQEKVSVRKKYRHELMSLEEVDFYMVPDNTSRVIHRLDELRLKMPKFICLNDDMNKTHEPPNATVRALHDFYISYFPKASPFERVSGKNEWMYIDDFRSSKKHSEQWNDLMMKSVAVLVVIVLVVSAACFYALLTHSSGHSLPRTSSIV